MKIRKILHAIAEKFWCRSEMDDEDRWLHWSCCLPKGHPGNHMATVTWTEGEAEKPKVPWVEPPYVVKVLCMKPCGSAALWCTREKGHEGECRPLGDNFDA